MSRPRFTLAIVIGLWPSLAFAAPPLAGLNDLTKLMAPTAAVAPADLDRLLEVAEAIAVRDATVGLSPSAVTYAATVEKSLPEAGASRPRAERVLLDLSLAIAPLAGPERAALTDPFYAAVLSALGMKPADAKPRPALSRELSQIGQWADATAKRLLDKLPKAEADPLRARLEFAAGHFDALAALARHHVVGVKAPDPRWQAWLAAGLLLQGRSPEPYLDAALAAGGEAAELATRARTIRDWQLADAAAPARLRSAGLAVVDPRSGGKPSALADACRKLVVEPASPAVAQAIAPCAILLGNPDATWMKRAAALAPKGAAGAPVRALSSLMSLAGEKSEAARKQTWADYHAEVEKIALAAAPRGELLLARYLLDARQTGAPATASPEDRPVLAALASAPCDARSLPFTIVVTPLAEQPHYLDQVTQRCAAKPGGVSATALAFEQLLYLSHQTPSPLGARPAPLEPRVRAFAAAHPDDPAAIAVHADAIALAALASPHPNPIALEAALARYDEAIAHATPASGATTLARLQSNAAYLSLTLAELLGKKSPAAKTQFTARAAHHLRYSLVFGTTPAAVGVRAHYQLELGSGEVDRASVDYLAKVPPEKGRARVACLLASEAGARGNRALTEKLLALAKQAPDPHRVVSDLPALHAESQISFGARLGQGTLHPVVDANTLLYLMPPCDPAQVTISPAAAPHAAR